jgi:hypothetical protein
MKFYKAYKHFWLINSIIFISILSLYSVSAQELNCNVVVVADQLSDANQQVFKTLEKEIDEFINQTKWTDKTYQPHEKIECSILLTLTGQSGNSSFSGSIQVQSSRPVYNSVYNTPVLNYKDDDLTFSYTEFEPLQYDENTYQSELVSTLSFFAYLIIGMDADTFSVNGGDASFKICQKIVDQVENPNAKKAWKSNTNKFNRYRLLSSLTSSNLSKFRKGVYNYHRLGLDTMADNERSGKEMIAEVILELRKLASNQLSSQLLRVFMDAKGDEVVAIFTDGPQIETYEVIEALNKIAPTMANKWQEIK